MYDVLDEQTLALVVGKCAAFSKTLLSQGTRSKTEGFEEAFGAMSKQRVRNLTRSKKNVLEGGVR